MGIQWWSFAVGFAGGWLATGAVGLAVLALVGATERGRRRAEALPAAIDARSARAGAGEPGPVMAFQPRRAARRAGDGVVADRRPSPRGAPLASGAPR